jgi:molybdenum cofactor cytidylyltransferase
MKFGDFRTAGAAGVLLAHTLRAGAHSFGKGHVLEPADLDVLRAAGIEFVTGARLEAGDVPENEAAAEIAALLAGDGTKIRAPYAGRCNVHAGARGTLVVEPDAVDRLNLLDEAIAIGTLPPWTVARSGQVLATVKIIPCAVPGALIERCREIVRGDAPLRLAALRPHRAAFIRTTLADDDGRTARAAEATLAATRQRLEALGSRLALELHAPHQVHAIADAMCQALAAGCDLVLIAGAAMTKDRMDVVPAAIVAAGGAIEHFGMPVEPGNMLLLARAAGVPVIGLPGCARSRRTNGLDWLLHRLLADLPVTRADIMRMGVGGLIRSPVEANDEDDPQGGAQEGPRAAPARERADPPPKVRVAALILAAGRSTRMGATNKLLAEVDGIPMVLRAVNAALASRATSVTVVLGHQAERLVPLLEGRPLRIVHNPDPDQGLSSSLRAGLSALPDEADAVLVQLADMPRIRATHLDRLIEAFDPAAPRIVVPEYLGQRGNPVLWPRAFIEQMSAIHGDRGARELLERHAGDLRRVVFDDDAVRFDVDTPEALATCISLRKTHYNA